MCDCTSGCTACSSAICLPRGPEGPGVRTVYYNSTRSPGAPTTPAITLAGSSYTVPLTEGIAKYEVLYVVDVTCAVSEEIQLSGWVNPVVGAAAEIDVDAKRFFTPTLTGTSLEGTMTYFVSDFSMGPGDIFYMEAVAANPQLSERGVIKLSKVIP
jgi:hypothetical protein